MDLFLALPQTRARFAFIEVHSGGMSRGMVMPDADHLLEMDGRECWLFAFGEVGPELFHRWDTLAVDASTGEVLLVDDDNGTLSPLD